MAASKRILFIINPISGIGQKNVIPELIREVLTPNEFATEIRHTEYRRHGFEIAQKEHANYDAIIAVGGDGSVNEIGSALIGTSCALGIVPGGSGNGLARHAGIPLDYKQAIQRIGKFEKQAIDTGRVNEHVFLGTCGFGFDAHIAQKFDEFHKRGFLSYIRLVAREFKRYPSITTKINLPDECIHDKALMVSVANSSQFGNGFTISPFSKINDGKFELIWLHKFPMIKAPGITWKFFKKRIHRSPYFVSRVFQESCTLESPEEIPFHADGEPLGKNKNFTIQIHPGSLLLI